MVSDKKIFCSNGEGNSILVSGLLGTVAKLLLLHHVNVKGNNNAILPHIHDFIILNSSVYTSRIVYSYCTLVLLLK